MKNLILITVFFSTVSCAIFAQPSDKKFTISGTVLDVNGTTIENATIFVDGIETRVRSDANGNYTIKVKKDARKIGVIALGNGILEEEIDGQNQIDFLFSRELVEIPEAEVTGVKPGEELVNTGYNVIRRKDLAGTVGFLDVEHSNKKYTTISQILMETPGLIFIGGQYVVAGATNFGGPVPPLYVIDGVPGGYVGQLRPSEVSNVTVLKGASAAIYGSRAMGGVVIFTTRIP